MAGSKTKLPKFLDDDIAKVQGASDKDDIIRSEERRVGKECLE